MQSPRSLSGVGGGGDTRGSWCQGGEHYKVSALGEDRTFHFFGSSSSKIVPSVFATPWVRDHLVHAVPRAGVLRPWRRATAPAEQPGVQKDVCGGHPFNGHLAEHAVDQRAGARWQRFRDGEDAAADLAEESSRLHVLEGVAAHQHGVEHHAQAPHVSRLPWVRVARVQDLRPHVSWASVLVRQGVVLALQQAGVLQVL